MTVCLGAGVSRLESSGAEREGAEPDIFWTSPKCWARVAQSLWRGGRGSTGGTTTTTTEEGEEEARRRPRTSSLRASWRSRRTHGAPAAHAKVGDLQGFEDVCLLCFSFYSPPALPKTCVRVLSCACLVRDGLNSAVFWWMRLSAILAPGGEADQTRSREVYHQPTHSSQWGEGVKIFLSSGADVLCWMHLFLSLLLGSRCPNTMQI